MKGAHNGASNAAPYGASSAVRNVAMSVLVLVVLALHQDFWLWRDRTLVLGFVPIGLAYQIGYSLLASATMAVLVHFLWPSHLRELESSEAPAVKSTPTPPRRRTAKGVGEPAFSKRSRP